MQGSQMFTILTMVPKRICSATKTHGCVYCPYYNSKFMHDDIFCGNLADIGHWYREATF